MKYLIALLALAPLAACGPSQMSKRGSPAYVNPYRDETAIPRPRPPANTALTKEKGQPGWVKDVSDEAARLIREAATLLNEVSAVHESGDKSRDSLSASLAKVSKAEENVVQARDLYRSIELDAEDQEAVYIRMKKLSDLDLVIKRTRKQIEAKL